MIYRERDHQKKKNGIQLTDLTNTGNYMYVDMFPLLH
ncbi:hypothetical protein [Plasmodium yoelii yoelii]|uniref:Uncharacterized protein n=1 Tax=Plasmodium yoelii yoelii TaxID=73239 RepID=Q7RSH8_PLAYO|nr:hypothetical protein [Plasmodium yoelii yoelii]